MTVATWPAYLPAFPLREGYGEQLGRNVIRSAMDSGPAKLRRRGSAAPDPVALVLLLTTEQVTTFETFFRATLKDGTERFAWTDPRQGVAREYRFTADAPDIKPSGVKWKLTAKLERLA
ncbi:hypothetical protein N825_25435 [Skermanella stibiiresistens SB22]|uniref:Phage tail protein n=1 Tax=Skermanella stibiiresistens SB22 TaxID=1385369 RepID=W9GSB6_9PROT|nr:hypothetical protein [Skermanella stibiiresistens]EWY36780.1 hypothetical protein N825_25435 [Skermanella stibiiresistens SB22]